MSGWNDEFLEVTSEHAGTYQCRKRNSFTMVTNKGAKVLRRVYDRGWLLILIRSWFQTLIDSMHSVQLLTLARLYMAVVEGLATLSWVSRCFNVGLATGSSTSTAVSSMSVPSVPVEEVMGDGSATSLGLKAEGESCAGGWSRLEGSDVLPLLSVTAHALKKFLACLKGVMGDLNGAGELGESVYGEKADMMGPVGDGNIGDLATAVIVTSSRVLEDTQMHDNSARHTRKFFG